MKIYTVSGLGADDKVLEKLAFRQGLEMVYIPWLIPEKDEEFQSYINRMMACIDESEEFYLLGYSFGGFIVQEIHKLKPAKKIVILGSIKSDKEKSFLIKFGEISKLTKYLPQSLFDEKGALFYTFLRKLFDPKNPGLAQYFRVKDPYYLKWSVDKISQWKFDGVDDVIQIMGDNDIVFPIKNSKPNFVIKKGSHLFPVTKHKEVSEILNQIFI